MCDTKFYSLLNEENDISWKRRYQDVYDKQKLLAKSDVTSIIDGLENGYLDRITEKPSDRAKYLVDNVESIRTWLDKTFFPGVLTINKADANKCLHELCLVEKRIRSMVNEINNINYSVKKKLKWRCNRCGEYIMDRKSDNDFWTAVQDHAHIEQALSCCSVIDHKQTQPMKVTGMFDNNSSANLCRSHSVQSSESTDNSIQSYVEANTDNSSVISNTSTQSCLSKNIVHNKLYPKRITIQVRAIQRNHLNTIIALSEYRYRCLLCVRDLFDEKTVLNHCYGKQHQFVLQDPYIIKNLQNYHKIFSHLHPTFQIHQVLFFPGNISTVSCRLCGVSVPELSIVEHVRGAKHRDLLNAHRGKKLFFHDEMVFSILQPLPGNTSNIPVTVKSQIFKAAGNTNNNIPTSSKKNATDTNSNIKKETADENLQQKPCNHNIVLSLLLDQNPDDIFSYLENRFHQHKKVITSENDNLTCSLCNVTFNNDVKDLKNHLCLYTHMRKLRKEIARPRWLYTCDICPVNEYTELNWNQHLQSVIHKQRLVYFSNKPMKGGACEEFECTTCLTVIFGNTFSINKHLQEIPSKSRKKKKLKEFKLPVSVEMLFKKEQTLNEELCKLSKESLAVIKTMDLNWQCCKAIERVIKLIFPDCKAYPFGSRVSGIGCMSSDLDVFVDTGIMYDGLQYQDADSQAALVKMTAQALRKHPDFIDICTIPSARTPIVQVYHKITDLDCDLSFRHGLSVENTEFLRLCIDVQPKLKSLILLLKRWSRMCRFNEKMSTYALAMMAIFFMQVHEYIPSVKQIRELDPTPSKVIAGWETFIVTKPISFLQEKVKPCTITAKILLADFFKYYTDFKFDLEVICPLLGHTVLKKDFEETDGPSTLPSEMNAYMKKIQTDSRSERFRNLSPICIQDPFDLSHNLTKACPLDMINRFVVYCKMSCNILTKAE